MSETPNAQQGDCATYTVGVTCGNCGKDSRMQIPVGRAIEETECLICGCKQLKRAMFATGYRT